MSIKTAAAAAASLNAQKRNSIDDRSFGPIDDFVAGYEAGAKVRDTQKQMFIEALEGLIKFASANSEFHSLAYARYLLKRIK